MNQPEEEEPQLCGAIDTATAKECVSILGHRGRHKFRHVPHQPTLVDMDPPTGMVN